MKVITNRAEWGGLIGEFAHHDFYHTFDYHHLDASLCNEDVEPIILSYEGRNGLVALPLLIRSSRLGSLVIRDATSVYGYAGPIATFDISEFPDDVADFQQRLHEVLNELGVVAVFSRLHPVLRNDKLVQGLGECQVLGKTVYLDLQESPLEQYSAFRSNHKRDIKKLQRLGVVCEISDSRRELGSFIKMYESTMQAADAASDYYFPESYYERLITADEFDVNLFVCRMEGQPICAGLFSDCCGIIQYHLGGTEPEFAQMSPSKMMFNSVREWGNSRGKRVFHLGGGVGARGDNLYRFKSGFSNHCADFAVWNWVVNETTYDLACAEYKNQLADRKLQCVDPGFFPFYRSPTVANSQ